MNITSNNTKNPIMSWQYGIRYKGIIVDKKSYYIDGKLHNIDGPTVSYHPIGVYEWWLYGVQFTKDGFNRLFNNPLFSAYGFKINEAFYSILLSKKEERIKFFIKDKEVTEQEFKNNILKGMS